MTKLQITAGQGKISPESYDSLLGVIERSTDFVRFRKVTQDVFRQDKAEFSLHYDPDGKIEFSMPFSSVIISYLIRSVAMKLGWSVNDVDLGYRLSVDPLLVPASYFSAVNGVPEMLDQGFRPVAFVVAHEDTSNIEAHYYEHIPSGAVHLVNPALLALYFTSHISQAHPELSYKVADSAEDLMRRDDHGLIPTNFYWFFKRDLKIINYSFYPIDHIKHKVFFVPAVYRFGNREDLNRLPGGGSLADKVRKGETLDQAIRRVLRDELKMADDYIGAAVTTRIEFDFDRDDKPTPKLFIKVVIADGELPKQAEQKMRRGWKSIDQSKT